MRIVQEISTHKAVATPTGIDIIVKGYKSEVISWEDEVLYSIPLENEEDVWAIMEGFKEQNRINLAEANQEF